MTSFDHARHRLSVFTKEESDAIVAYLEFCRDADPSGFNAPGITAALNGIWLARAKYAPTRAMLQQHLDDEATWLRQILEP